MEWEVEINDDFFPLVKLFHLLFKPRGYKQRIKHCLIFGEECLRYYRAEAMLWRIEHSRLSHLEAPPSFSPTSAFENSYTVFIHTNDRDKYDFASTLSPTQLEELKSRIEQLRKSHNQSRKADA